MDFQLRYFRWFLDNYRYYSYNGKKAKELRRELDDFYLSQDVPNIREMKALYAKFLIQYKGDILTSTPRNGVLPRRGDYYLVFEVEEYLVPLNFISYYQRIEASYLGDVLDYLVNQRIKLYNEAIELKKYLVEKNDIAIRKLDNHERQFIILKENITVFAILIFIPALAALSLFIQPFVEFMNLTPFNLILLQIALFSLTAIYGLIICGFIADNQTILKGKQINMGLFDLEQELEKTSKKLLNFNREKTITSILNGKVIHGKVKEPNYDAELSGFSTAIAELEKGKIIKSKVKKVLYEISNYTLDAVTIFAYLSVYFGANLLSGITLAVSLVSAIPVFIGVRSVVNRIHVRAIVANFLISIAVAVFVMFIISWVLQAF